jgi:hypothetical protein
VARYPQLLARELGFLMCDDCFTPLHSRCDTKRLVTIDGRIQDRIGDA